MIDVILTVTWSHVLALALPFAALGLGLFIAATAYVNPK